MIDKDYVLNTKKIYRADEPEKYKYCTEFAGDSDIASLAFRTSKSEIGEIPFGEDGGYDVHLIAGNTEVPQHYKDGQILDTDASWLWIYDDYERTLELANQDGFEVYTAGMRGFLIRFK